jgi:hypothetical protein
MDGSGTSDKFPKGKKVKRNIDMGKTFDPEKYEMIFCSLCKTGGKLPKSTEGSGVYKECGGFGLIKNQG